jgi:hypothetical protein
MSLDVCWRLKTKKRAAAASARRSRMQPTVMPAAAPGVRGDAAVAEEGEQV